MAPRLDTRRVVWSRVHALAIHVTSEVECARRFGAHKSTKLVSGTVLDVRVDTSGRRASTYVTAEYLLGGSDYKKKELNIRSVREGDALAIVPTAGDLVLAADPAASQPIAERDDGRRKDGKALTVPAGSSTAAAPAEIVCHGTKWVRGEEKLPINGLVPFRPWALRTPTGEILTTEGGLGGRQPVDLFLLTFPPMQLAEMLKLTNSRLRDLRKRETTVGAILKYQGLLILMTRFKFGSRATLWQQHAEYKYIPAPSFGKTGMSRQRFDDLHRCVRYSFQPPERPGDMSSERYRWRLFEDFVNRFNDYRAQTFIPSDLICVDESMSRWYEAGGHWINEGLPMYIAIDWKPENGCEIQNSACGRSGVMLQLKLVTTAEEQHAHHEQTDDCLPHGTSVLKQLVAPWVRTGSIVSADSYFSSVASAEELFNIALRFVGIVKAATKRFPMAELSRVHLVNRGDMRGLVLLDANKQPRFLAFVWMDRERRYFISTCSSFSPGTPYSRKRLRQVSEKPSAPPERVELTIPQPEAAEIYYSSCGMIDRHNRCRQDDLELERAIGITDWSQRVNISLFGMCVVDAWLVHKACSDGRGCNKQAEFYTTLAHQLIDNTYDGIGRRERQVVCEQSVLYNEGAPASGVGVHLTPTKEKKKGKGASTTFSKQGRCRVCSSFCTTLCSSCEDNKGPGDKATYICAPKRGRMCWPTHTKTVHKV